MANQAPSKENPMFMAGAILVILANITCGVFAFLAEQKIGHKDLFFTISFTFLGLVVIGIFALAAIDTKTRNEQHDWEFEH
jgi:hypothetical protein